MMWYSSIIVREDSLVTRLVIIQSKQHSFPPHHHHLYVHEGMREHTPFCTGHTNHGSRHIQQFVIYITVPRQRCYTATFPMTNIFTFVTDVAFHWINFREYDNMLHNTFIPSASIFRNSFCCFRSVNFISTKHQRKVVFLEILHKQKFVLLNIFANMYLINCMKSQKYENFNMYKFLLNCIINSISSHPSIQSNGVQNWKLFHNGILPYPRDEPSTSQTQVYHRLNKDIP